MPSKGCFTATYPNIQWREAACKTPPNVPLEPAKGHLPQVVGNGDDFSAVVSGSISSATGSFDSISSGATETGQVNATGSQIANTYTLQLNTAPFTTTRCLGAANPAVCQGWQQFVYDTSSNDVYIQYWLENYDTTCPFGWKTYGGFCWQNDPIAGSLPGSVPTIADLANDTLTGTAAANGTDTVVMTIGSGHAIATNVDSALNLAGAWKVAEFAILGDGGGGEANFSAGTTLKVRTSVQSGTRTAPTCVRNGYTAETNNLNLVGTPAIAPQGSPAIVSEQTYSPGTAASCAAAQGIGDTHLTTFRNLFYDFQASGDFVLARTGPHFTVQARQVSGAPTWPNAAVNRAVAAQVGKFDVAVCLSPTRLEINGRTLNLATGGQRNLSAGDVSRYGNVYLIRDGSGDSVRAEVNPGNPSWINVSVGLGRWPATVRGLLANAGSDVNAIQTRGGTVLTAPFAIGELYDAYGNSWRVPSSRSLLSPCGRKFPSGNPKQPFYANGLKPAFSAPARAACLRTGVEAPPLLDACTVDVVVLRNKAAAKAYLSVPTDVTWGKITTPRLR